MQDRKKILGEIAYQQAQKMHASLRSKQPLSREQAIDNIIAECPFTVSRKECESALSKSLFAAAF